MVPCGADDFVQVRKRPIVRHYEWYAAGWGFLLVRHKGAPVERGCSVDGFRDMIFTVSSTG